MKNKIPQGPRYNPHVEDGTYDAVIERVTMGAYGEKGDFYVQIVCRLPDLDLYFVTTINLPPSTAQRSGQPRRPLDLVHEMMMQDLRNMPRILTKQKHVRVEIVRIPRKDENEGNTYCDVEQFLSAEPDGEESNEP